MRAAEIDCGKEDLGERCGIEAIFSASPDFLFPIALQAASGIQHRGQKGFGITQSTEYGFRTITGDTLIRDGLSNEAVESLDEPSQWILAHCRYGTSGDYFSGNLQPCIATTEDGEQVAVIHNGQFVNEANMRSRVAAPLSEGVSDTYIFTQLLAQAKGNSWDEKVLRTLAHVNGAYSLVIGVKDALFVARDDFGIRPLFLGQVGDKWMVASETYAFQRAGGIVHREVHKGEVLRIDKEGIAVLKKGQPGVGNSCDFEYAYFQHPASRDPVYYEEDDGEYPDRWPSITSFRYRCGGFLAHQFRPPNASFVTGVPDSGNAVASGYAYHANIPHIPLIIRDHYSANGTYRLFMADHDKQKIRKKVLGKLVMVPDEHWKNAVVVIGDDSIVRGNVSAEITAAAFGMGAREVHWVIGFSPVIHACHLGVSMRSEEELAAAKYGGDPVKIAQEIGATSVHYITPQGFLAAKGRKLIVPEDNNEIFLVNGGCGGCVTGLYPISAQGVVYERNRP